MIGEGSVGGKAQSASRRSSMGIAASQRKHNPVPILNPPRPKRFRGFRAIHNPYEAGHFFIFSS